MNMYGNMINFNGPEMDSAYLWEMYPRESRIINRLVEEALDMEDYRGSFIYDEYPDKFLFLRMANRIAKKYGEVTKTEGVMENNRNVENNMNTADNENTENCERIWISQIVKVILANEIIRRRNRKRYYW